ncbi:MAG: DNA repair protein RecN [Myxococcota bacterium]|nr:DNA repair protein RecN [Myxococcota bacterium]
MLTWLHISNLALIEESELEFGPGMTAITGETGAGKSMIIGALKLLAGGRAGAGDIRNGAEKAMVEGVFQLAGDHPALARLRDMELGDGDELAIRRVIMRSGKGRIFINGASATLNQLQEIGRTLLAISGQHEHIMLGKPEEQLSLLDSFSGVTAKVRQLEALYRQVKAVESELSVLEQRLARAAEREGYLRFALEEIERVKPEPGEDAAIEARLKQLSHASDLVEGAGGVAAMVYAGPGAASEILGRAERELERLSRLDPSIAPWIEPLREARALVEDAGQGLDRYAREIEIDPEALEKTSQRLAELRSLCRKYGGSTEVVARRAGELRAELDALDTGGQQLGDLRSRAAELWKRYHSLARELTQKRMEAANDLCARLARELAGLGMPGASLRFDFRETAPGPSGVDRVDLTASANPGEPPRPLGKVASGGELSRILLALKAVTLPEDPVALYVFDEIDAGIGGGVADLAGRRLADLSGRHQVFCVTHLAQIASLADQQIHIEKIAEPHRTVSRHRLLDGDDRIEELARMAGGLTVTPATRELAREMLRRRSPVPRCAA